MFSQVLLLFKCFDAIIAMESLLTSGSMCLCMVLQIVCLNKIAGALGTFVWLFSSMRTSHADSHMATCDA